MTAVDSAGVLWPVVLRLGEPSVARVELVGHGVFGSGDDDHLSCLVAVREYLEERGRLLCCQGARPDVWPSGMLRQFENGRRAYVLDRDRRGAELEVVDIFAPAPAEMVVSVLEQGKAVFAFYGLPWRGE
ncbi:MULTISPECIES: hypothetical protein [unclassified Nocardia]|uniref:hypothetical protein n=1 Tax=unclassified Nocardia TaxID=2637762 RepID=UPI001CE4A793|nr:MULTISPECIES: hypothetical protein [unclassified Nocardia]